MSFLNDIRNKAKRAPRPAFLPAGRGKGFHRIIEYADCFGEVVYKGKRRARMNAPLK
jgi:hypothetical protein